METNSVTPSDDASVKSNKPEAYAVDVAEKDVTCDYAFCAPAWCQKLRNRKLMLFWISWCAFVQSMTISGFINGVITTLERRYRLTSTESGGIASTYDVGVLLVLIPLSYLGGNWRRLRVLAWGMLVMAIGIFLTALPQLTSGTYKYQTPIPPLCYRDANVSYSSYCDATESGLNNYKYLFWISQVLLGVGASPIYILGPSYLDDNLRREASSLYFAIFYTTSLIGPAVGFLLSSTFLEIYVDIGAPHPNLSMKNKETWVGAWWLGFILAGVLSLIAVIPLYGFPKEMPGTADIREKRRSEAFGKSDTVATKSRMTWYEFLSTVKQIVTNPTFMGISISGVLESILVSGFALFGAKYLETIFKLEASKASLVFGLVIVPAGGSGTFIGGAVIRCFKMKLKSILRMQAIAALVVLPFLFTFFIRCGSPTVDGGIAGVTVQYNDSQMLATPKLVDTCNADCQCVDDTLFFEVTCGMNDKTYFSPCYAGCTSKSISGFHNCSCISSNKNGTTPLTMGSCTNTCTNLPIFMSVFAIVIFLIFFISTPSITATIRCIPEKQKTFAIGCQWLMIRTLGTIPGPLVFGKAIDSTCTLWNKRCDVQGSCSFYNGTQLTILIIIIGVTVKFLSFVSLAVAWLLYKEPEDESKEIDHKVVVDVYKNGHDNIAYKPDGKYETRL